ncbi:MAG: hypothetical protein AAF619_10555 [Pseudomonadota bacterium]
MQPSVPNNALLQQSPTHVAKTRLRAYATPILLTSLVINVLLLATPIYMMQVFDRVLMTGSIETLTALTGIAILAVLAYAALESARGSLLIRTGKWLDSHFTEAFFPSSSAEDRPLIAQDITQIRSALAGRTGTMALDMPWVPVFLIPLFLLHPAFAALAIVMAAVLVSIALLLDKKDAKTVIATRLAFQQATKALDASRVSTEPRYLEGAVKLRQNGVALQSVSQETTASALNIAKGVRLAGQLFVLAIGAWLVINDALSAGGLIAASLMFARAAAPFEQTIGGLREFLAAREAWQRLETRGVAATREALLKRREQLRVIQAANDPELLAKRRASS